MKITILGGPGSGKGTLGSLLAEHLSIKHISLGHVLRQSKNADVIKTITAGQLVSDETAIETLQAYLADNRIDDFIIDGYPRTLNQAKMLDATINKPDVAIYLNVSTDILESRLVTRLTCACGAIFNLISKRPALNYICDVCKQELSLRLYDTVDTIKDRISIFERNIDGILDFYDMQARENVLLTIDASQNIDTVFRVVMQQIETITR